jgi:hypothetical protein
VTKPQKLSWNHRHSLEEFLSCLKIEKGIGRLIIKKMIKTFVYIPVA